MTLITDKFVVLLRYNNVIIANRVRLGIAIRNLITGFVGEITMSVRIICTTGYRVFCSDYSSSHGVHVVQTAVSKLKLD